MNKKEISVLLGLVLTIAFSLCFGYITDAQQIRANTLRLHVIANSNSKVDQSAKLAVKEYILSMEDILPNKAADFASAQKAVRKNMPQIENAVNKFLQQNNLSYTARCSLEQFYFDTTRYSGFALPKGEYTALTVRLGKAQGKNWWCVIYPALCSQSCGEIVLENSDGFIKTARLTPRFKIVEIYEDIKGKLVKSDVQQYTNLE
ncbi:MAG: stage II sporulation protein R [Oscillospiraceae bacterium]|nr:stage II sporulation protein R [Oscillospiraceae bacterium]